MSIIQISHLFKTYRGNDVPAVNDLSFSVEAGERFGLLGANGAGKTTTLSILCGLRRFSQGEVWVAHHSVVKEMAAIKPLIGVVPQDFALYAELSAEENLRIFGGLYGIPTRELKERISSLLHYYDLYDCRQRPIAQYSGGMKRRVNLIAGILHRPQILFLDEPTVGVDVKSRHAIMDSLLELNAQGTTLVYTSHLLEEAQTFCTRLGVMAQGRMVCLDTPARLMDTYKATSLDDLCLQLIP